MDAYNPSTDSEVFERRYPVLLREFSLRQGSAGKGMHVGGEGVVRDIEFRIPVQVSILSERRVYHPYGMQGGGDAACGLNIWARKVNRKNIDKNSDDKKGIDRDAQTAGLQGLDAKPNTNGESKSENEEEYRFINLGAKNTAAMQPGERIIIHTPGGGGWGKEGDESNVKDRQDPKAAWRGGSVAERQAAGEASA